LRSSGGCSVEFLDYGCTIRSLLVPDRNGKLVDVVLGYDSPCLYEKKDDYFGATAGRFANRIAHGQFVLDGAVYRLACNNGPHHLHGGDEGFSHKFWDVSAQDDRLIFSRTSPDGEEGYPGTMHVRVTAFWSDPFTLRLNYEAETDRKTPINLTNHSYFNLSGSGTIDDHLLQISAEYYTESDETCLPTGVLLPAEGAMDFRTPRPVGSGLYDHNYILTGSPAAVLSSAETGITMTVTTDQPGVQLYAGCFIHPAVGKYGQHYDRRHGLCLETQHYPDSVHHPEWPSAILCPGEIFRSFTAFSFGKDA